MRRPTLGATPGLKRFRWNVVGYSYSQLVTLASQFLTIPVFLHYWGTERYGEWLVLTGLPTLLGLMDLGVGQASGTRAMMLAAQRRYVEVAASLQTAQVFTLIISTLIAAASLSLVIGLDISSILEIENLDSTEVNVVLLLMTGYLIINLQGGPLDGWFKVTNRTAFGAFMLANRRSIDLAVTVAIISMGGSAGELACFLLSAQIFYLFILWWLVGYGTTYKVASLSSASLLEFRTIWRAAVAYSGFPLAQAITLQGGTQVLNQIATPHIVVAYTMTRTMVRLIIQIGVVINNALKPEISRLAGEADLASAKKHTLHATLLVTGVGLILFVVILAFGPQIISWWSGNAVHVDRQAIFLIGMHALINIAWFVPAAFFIAQNKHSKTAGLYFFSSVTALLCWLLFAKTLPPLTGAGFALAVPEAVMVAYYGYLLRKTPRIPS